MTASSSPQGRNSTRAALHGVRILDFTCNAAGPYATWLLAMLGAEVVKVESQDRPDPARGIADRPYAHSVFYEDVNAGKRCISLNMKRPEGVALARALLDHCDAVVDSFRPGVMNRWGLDENSLRGHFPRLVVASLSATGSTGPLAGLPGYAGVFNALGGLGGLTGYEGGPPTELRTSIDLRAGAMYAMVIAGALYDARRTGLGRRVDFSAVEAVALLSGEYLTAALLGALDSDKRMGNRDEKWSPHGVFETADSQWLALAVRSDHEWECLARLMTADGVDVPGTFATDEARLEAVGAVDQVTADWVKRHRRDDLDRRLRDAGVPSSGVLDAREVAADEQLASRDFYQRIPGAGGDTERVVASAPWMVDGCRTPVAAAHDLGDDTLPVLAELLGMTETDIERLAADGVVSIPRQAVGQ